MDRASRFIFCNEAKKSITLSTPPPHPLLWNALNETMNHFPLDELSHFADIKIADEKFILLFLFFHDRPPLMTFVDPQILDSQFNKAW